MHNDILNLFNSIAPLSPEETDVVKTMFKPIQLPKGEYFLESDSICRKVGFITKGLVRYFVF